MIKKKYLIPLICVVLLILMCVPIKHTYKDGGTVSYKAILYSNTDYHRMQDDGTYYEATEFKLFPFNYVG